MLPTLAQLEQTRSSRLSWADIHETLADLIAEFATPSRTGRVQSAAFPFTRLRSDGIWHLSADVPMAKVAPLAKPPVSDRFPLHPARPAPQNGIRILGRGGFGPGDWMRWARRFGITGCRIIADASCRLAIEAET